MVGLATWRLANALVLEEGPFYILQKLRERFGVEHNDGVPINWPDNSVFTCIYCMSFWIAILLLVVPLGFSLPFAVSAVAILVFRFNR